jgi:hypothetical protein
MNLSMQEWRAARAVGHILTAGAPQCALRRVLTYSYSARHNILYNVQLTGTYT